MGSTGGMMLKGENWNLGGQPVSVPLFLSNVPACTGLEFKPGLHCDRLVNNFLNHGTSNQAGCIITYRRSFQQMGCLQPASTLCTAISLFLFQLWNVYPLRFEESCDFKCFFITGLMAANGFQCLDGNIQHASAERD